MPLTQGLLYDFTAAHNEWNLDASDVNAFLASIGHVRAPLNLRLKPGAHTLTEPWETIPDGQRIQIIGAPATVPDPDLMTGDPVADRAYLESCFGTVINLDCASLATMHDAGFGRVMNILTIGGVIGVDLEAARTWLHNVHMFGIVQQSFSVTSGSAVTTDFSVSHGRDGVLTNFCGSAWPIDFWACDMTGYAERANHGGGIYNQNKARAIRCTTGYNATDQGEIWGNGPLGGASEAIGCGRGLYSTRGTLRFEYGRFLSNDIGVEVRDFGWATVDNGEVTGNATWDLHTLEGGRIQKGSATVGPKVLAEPDPPPIY